MTTRILFNRLGLVSSFALLGATTAGAFLGWIDTSIDLRAVGAVIGAGAASLKVFNIV
jgi:hypothetical protein